MNFAIPLPNIDPVLVEIGPFAIHWYAPVHRRAALGFVEYTRGGETSARSFTTRLIAAMSVELTCQDKVSHTLSKRSFVEDCHNNGPCTTNFGNKTGVKSILVDGANFYRLVSKPWPLHAKSVFGLHVAPPLQLLPHTNRANNC